MLEIQVPTDVQFIVENCIDVSVADRCVPIDVSVAESDENSG